jgi:hypothetical protein
MTRRHNQRLPHVHGARRDERWSTLSDAAIDG